MREVAAFSAVGSAALLTLTLTLALAGGTTFHHATELSSRQRQQLDASINRIVTEQVARRDEIFHGGAAGKAHAGPVQTVAALPDVTDLLPGEAARKEAARQNRDPEERAERETRAAAARPAKERTPSPVAASRPDQVMSQAVLSMHRLTFGVLP
jgi:hypothetical protein